MTDLAPLLDALRRGEMPRLSLDDVDALLIWLSGGRADSGLPNPDHDPVLLQMVFYRLDATLFSGGELKLDAAGLSTDHPYENRLLRFRRLNRTFHPDRYPQLGDWLTERSQAVHRAYALFKRQPESDPPEPVRATVQPPPPGARQQRMRPSGPLRQSRRRLRHALLVLRARFGRDRYLPHKLVGGLAVLALLPVLNIVLAPGGLERPTGVVTDGAIEETAGDVAPAYSPTPDPGVGRPHAAGNRTTTPDPSVGRPHAAGDRTTTPDPSVGRPHAAGSTTSRHPGLDPGSSGFTGETKDTGSRLEAGMTSRADGAGMTSGADGAGVTPEADGADTEPTPLLLAARRAMNPNGDGLSEVATLPTVDEQLAAMGLADDTERLYRKMNQRSSTERGAAAGKARAGDVAPAYSPTPDPGAGRPHAAGNRTTTPDPSVGRPHAAGNQTTTQDPRVGRPHVAGNQTTTPDPSVSRPHAAGNQTTTQDPRVGRPHVAGNQTTTPDPGVGRPHVAGNRTTTPDPRVSRPHVAGDKDSRHPGLDPGSSDVTGETKDAGSRLKAGMTPVADSVEQETAGDVAPAYSPTPDPSAGRPHAAGNQTTTPDPSVGRPHVAGSTTSRHPGLDPGSSDFTGESKDTGSRLEAGMTPVADSVEQETAGDVAPAYSPTPDPGVGRPHVAGDNDSRHPGLDPGSSDFTGEAKDTGSRVKPGMTTVGGADDTASEEPTTGSRSTVNRPAVNRSTVNRPTVQPPNRHPGLDPGSSQPTSRHPGLDPGSSDFTGETKDAGSRLKAGMTPVADSVEQETAGDVAPAYSPTPDPSAGRPHAAGNQTTTPDPGVGRPHAAGNRTAPPDPSVGRPHAAGNRTTTPDPGVGRPHVAGNQTTTPDPGVGRPHVAGDRAPGASPERGLALPPGRLTLGPFASAPAGKTLAGFVEAVESGDVLALGLLFDGRARHRGERGIDDITAHYRALFGRTRARAVDLRLLKLERDGDTTRVEAQLTLRGVSDGTIKTLEDGRVEFELDDNDPPRILRLQAIRD